MIPDKRLRQIATALATKTKTGQVKWTTREFLPQVTSYQVVLPGARVVVTYTTPRAEPDFITLDLQNPSKVSVGSWTAVKPDEQDELNATSELDEWQILYALFAEAHRVVTGWDKVVSDIETALAGQEPIGNPNAQ